MTDLPLNMLFTRNPDLIATDMDGDTVMMNIANGKYYGISGVGSRVWELLAKPITISEMVSTICMEFEVEKSTCKADIERFIDEMHAFGLIVVP